MQSIMLQTSTKLYVEMLELQKKNPTHRKNTPAIMKIQTDTDVITSQTESS